MTEKTSKRRKQTDSDDNEAFFRNVIMDDVDDDYLSSLKENIDKPDIPVFLQWHNISYNVQVGKGKETKTILKDISGKVVPGELLAIMGPTGSGKTTLLSILADRLKKGVTGDVLVNGKEPTVNFKRQVGFIQQDDLLFANLTVQQTFDFTADISLPDSISAQERKDVVDSMFEVLNLGKTRNTAIGGYGARGVSGGERKRVNIGNQLIKKPSLILLDEPTSGLDTSTAVNLIKMLKAMCAAGMTVVTTIHQPASQIYELFDNLLLMVEGRSIYYGAADQAINYFSSLGLRCEQYYNPADFMMGLILKEEVSNKAGISLKSAMIKEYKKRIGYDVDLIESNKEKKQLKKCQRKQDGLLKESTAEYPTSFFSQFGTLFRRSWFDFSKIYITGLNFFEIIAVAVIAGAIWFQTGFSEESLSDVIGSLFFTGMFASGFFPAFISLLNFPTEKQIIVRERSDGMYRLSSYFVSKAVAEVPFVVFFPLLFGIVIYLLCGYVLQPVNMIGYLAVLMSGAFASAGFGLCISAAVASPPKAPVVASVFLTFFMISAGFYVNLNDMPSWLSWIAYLSYFKWSHNGILSSQFVGMNITQNVNVSSGFDSYAGYIPGEAILTQQFVTFHGSGFNVLILILFGIVFRIIAFIILSFTMRPKN